jgi:general secretion pathway protein J
VDQEGNDFDYWNSDSDEFDYATPTAVDFTIELVQGGTTSFFETRVSLPVKREPLE